MHVSLSRSLLLEAVDSTLQPRRLHVMPAGIAASGSSDSSSGGGAGEEGGLGVAWVWGWRGGAMVPGWTNLAASSGAMVLGSGAGVSSTVQWRPVVQGGMVMNSSNVRTRGLQHFQPEKSYQLDGDLKGA